MTTKKDAAGRTIYVANLIRESLAGDKDADLWVALLEGIAYDLHAPTYSMHAAFSDGPSMKVKLRTLIDHPATPQPEREAALAALAKREADRD